MAEEHFDVFGRADLPDALRKLQDRLAPFGVYQTNDGHVAIAAFQPDWMKGLSTRSAGRVIEDPRFSSRGHA